MRLDYKWRAALITSVGLFMAVLDNTVVNVSLQQMATYFHTDIPTIRWVVTAYFLAQAAIIPVTGYLSDLIGTKTVFLSALALFTVGSALCSFAPSEGALITFRVLQGIGGGALFPTVIAIIFRAFPPAERGAAGAVVGVPILLAPAFGPTIGGYLTTNYDWNAIFLVNVPIGILTFMGAALILRGREADRAADGTPALARRRRFDVPGLVLAMAGFTALVYGISAAGTTTSNGQQVLGWRDPTVITFLVAGVVILGMFVVNELLVSDPVIDLRLFRNYTFTTANLLMWAISGLFFGSILLLPLFFENVGGLTPLNTGEIFILQGLAAGVGTAASGRLYNVVGPRVLATAGFVLVTAGTWGLTRFTVTTTGQEVQFWLILRGLGLGFTNIPLQTLALSVVSNRAMARASSLVNVMRQVAGAVGASLVVTYVTQQATSHIAAAQAAFTDGPLAEATRRCIAQFGQSPQAQACVGQFAQVNAKAYVTAHAFTTGFNDTFLIVSTATGVCILLALLVGSDPNVIALRRKATKGTASGEQASEPRPAVIAE
jgi:EmrB/QacA subfamily drug resistance transporter